MKAKPNSEIGVHLGFHAYPTERAVGENIYSAGEYIHSRTSRYGEAPVKLVGFRENAAIVDLENGHRTVINYKKLFDGDTDLLGVKSYNGERAKETTIKDFSLLEGSIPFNTSYVRWFLAKEKTSIGKASQTLGKSWSFLYKVLRSGVSKGENLENMVNKLGMDRDSLIDMTAKYNIEENIVRFDSKALVNEINERSAMTTFSEEMGHHNSYMYRICKEAKTTPEVWKKITGTLRVPYETFLI